MAGMYSAQMGAMRFGVSDHRFRQACQACGLALDLNDQVDADAVEKNSAKLQKWLDDDMAAHMEAKEPVDKAAWLEAHNAKVEKAMANGWEAAVAAGASSSKSEDKE